MTAHWGCWNTPRRDGYWANEKVINLGKHPTVRVAEAVWIEDTSSRECQHRKGTPGDPKCEGCLKP